MGNEPESLSEHEQGLQDSDDPRAGVETGDPYGSGQTGYPPVQPVYPATSAPAYHQPYAYPRVRYENFAMTLIIVGSILIGVGLIVLGMSPKDITFFEPTGTDNEVDIELRITPITIGCILAGMGTMFEGMGAALNIKAYFALKAMG